MTEDTKPKRGFAAMTPERRQEAQRKGGASVPPDKRTFAKNRALASEAGKKGGRARRSELVSSHMDKIMGRSE